MKQQYDKYEIKIITGREDVLEKHLNFIGRDKEIIAVHFESEHRLKIVTKTPAPLA